MISEFSVYAKPTNNKAKLTFWVLVALASASFAGYVVMSQFKINKSGLVGFLALILIVAAVFIYTKYVSPKTYYDVTHDSDGTAVFVVRQIIGKRATTLCRIALCEIVQIVRETAAERKAHKTPFSTRKYVYLPTMSSAVSYRLITRNRYESAEILIEVSDEYADTLLSYVKEAKEIELLREASDPY